MSEEKNPWWLWPGLLSLDAPLVAVAWLYMFASAWQVNYLPWPAYATLGVSVWVVYVIDRLLDQKLRSPKDPLVGERHRFHHRHRKGFLGGVAIAILILLWLVFFAVPGELLRFYLMPGIVLVVVFFILVMSSPDTREIPFIRNLVAGAAFSFGTSMMAHVYVPTQGVESLIISREMIAFGVLCAVNITAIHLWEHSRLSDDPDVKSAMEGLLTMLLTIVGASALVYAYLQNPNMFSSDLEGDTYRARPFFYAILITSALFLVINKNRHRFSLEALRTLADLAMIVPLPLFLILSRG